MEVADGFSCGGDDRRFGNLSASVRDSDSDSESDFQMLCMPLSRPRKVLLCLMICCHRISWGHTPAVRDTAGHVSVGSCEGG